MRSGLLGRHLGKSVKKGVEVHCGHLSAGADCADLGLAGKLAKLLVNKVKSAVEVSNGTDLSNALLLLGAGKLGNLPSRSKRCGQSLKGCGTRASTSWSPATISLRRALAILASW